MTFKMPRNLMAAVSVVAFAALLSSCGGGGGSSPVATMDDDTTMTPDDTTMAGPMIAGKTVPSGTEITLPEGTARSRPSQSLLLWVKRLLSQVLPVRVPAPMAARLM